MSISNVIFRRASFTSSDAETASDFVRAVKRGLEGQGLAATAKHFPGHGDTHVDSHLALPVIAKDLEALEKTELLPFRAAIDDNISSIMTGHMALPKLAVSFGVDPEDRPASLSRGVVTNLLRNKLEYEGVVVTDCLEMDAISAGIGCGPGAVLALQAGTDIVMICHRLDRQLAALGATYAAFEQGALSESALLENNARVLALKEKVAGSWEDVLGRNFDPESTMALLKTNAALHRRAYARTTRWLTALTTQLEPYDDVLVLTPQLEAINPAVDDPELKPLMHNPSSPVQSVASRNTAGPSYVAFAAAVAARAPFSTHITYAHSDAAGMPEALVKQVLSTSSVVFVTRNAHQESSRWQLSVLRHLMDVLARPTPIRDGQEAEDELKRTPTKVILLASCNPYDLQLFQSDSRTKELSCLCTFEFTRPALEEAAAKLYGESLAA